MKRYFEIIINKKNKLNNILKEIDIINLQINNYNKNNNDLSINKINLIKELEVLKKEKFEFNIINTLNYILIGIIILGLNILLLKKIIMYFLIVFTSTFLISITKLAINRYLKRYRIKSINKINELEDNIVNIAELMLSNSKNITNLENLRNINLREAKDLKLEINNLTDILINNYGKYLDDLIIAQLDHNEKINEAYKKILSYQNNFSN